MKINASAFGREVLHCVHSQHFNPWSVMERYPYMQGPADIYLIYACGEEFVLSGANLKLEVAQYEPNTERSEVERLFKTVYSEALSLTGEAAQGY